MKEKINHNFKRTLAFLLALVMLLTSVPANVFAQEPGGTSARAADKPEKSDTDKDANNAVHGYVGLTQGVNIDQDMSAVTGDQFTPKAGIDVYFQWYEGLNGPNQYTSPVYKATSGTDGQFHMAVHPYIAQDGKIIKFDADPTVSAGNERYKFWVDEKTIPDGYALQYITGEGVVFPDKGLPITKVEQGLILQEISTVTGRFFSENFQRQICTKLLKERLYNKMVVISLGKYLGTMILTSEAYNIKP